MPPHFLERAHQAIARNTKFTKNPPSRTRVLRHCQQQMLDGNVIVLQLFRFILGLREQPIQPAADMHLLGAPGRTAYPWHALQLPLHAHFESVDGDVRLAEDGRGQALFLVEQCQQEMFNVHLLLSKTTRQALGAGQTLLSLLGEAVDVTRIHMLTAYSAISANSAIEHVMCTIPCTNDVRDRRGFIYMV